MHRYASERLLKWHREGVFRKPLIVQGARQVKKKWPSAVLIFVLPPKMEELTRRLKKRKTDSATEIRRRFKMAKWEMAQRKDYDYQIVNDRLSSTVKVLEGILAERRRVR